MNVFVVIPVFNESKRIGKVLSTLKQAAPLVRVIVVDDGSGDKTDTLFSSLNDQSVTYLRHKINLGKGCALRTGCEAAIKMGADCIVLMDGDGQHSPEDVLRLVEKLEQEKLDIVFGCRTIGKDMPLVMMLGNKFLSIMTRILFGIYVSDTQSGFRGFTKSAYEKIRWNSKRYDAETEMIVNTGKAKLKFGDIQIKTIYNDNYKGTTVLDGIRIFINMLTWRIL